MRVKAVVSHTSVSFDDLRSHLLELKYDPTDSDRRPYGFEVVSYDGGKVEAKFIERVVLKDVVVDPFGDEATIESVRYNFINFSAYSVGSEVVFLIFSPPRSVSNLVGAISEALGGGFFFRSARFDVVKSLDVISRPEEVSINSITSVVANDVFVDSHATAKVEMKSSKNALDDLKEFLDGSRFSVARLVFGCDFGQFSSRIEISTTGALVLSEEAFEFFEYMIVHEIVS